eukprot:COSAG02_NODE_298_length_25350_cov_48.266999_14_plen_70_part_00
MPASIWFDTLSVGGAWTRLGWRGSGHYGLAKAHSGYAIIMPIRMIAEWLTSSAVHQTNWSAFALHLRLE